MRVFHQLLGDGGRALDRFAGFDVAQYRPDYAFRVVAFVRIEAFVLESHERRLDVFGHGGGIDVIVRGVREFFTVYVQDDRQGGGGGEQRGVEFGSVSPFREPYISAERRCAEQQDDRGHGDGGEFQEFFSKPGFLAAARHFVPGGGRPGGGTGTFFPTFFHCDYYCVFGGFYV